MQFERYTYTKINANIGSSISEAAKKHFHKLWMPTECVIVELLKILTRFSFRGCWNYVSSGRQGPRPLCFFQSHFAFCPWCFFVLVNGKCFLAVWKVPLELTAFNIFMTLHLSEVHFLLRTHAWSHRETFLECALKLN